MLKKAIFALVLVIQLAAVAGVRTELDRIPLPGCYPCGDVR